MALIACPSCRTKFKVKPQTLGKQIACPRCREEFRADPLHERERKSSFNPVWLAIGGVGLLVVIFGMMSSQDDETPPGGDRTLATAPPQEPEAAPTPPPRAVGPGAAVDRAQAVLLALRDDDDTKLTSWLDYLEHHARKRAAGAVASSWSDLAPEEQYAAKSGFLDEVKGGGVAGDATRAEFWRAAVVKELALESSEGAVAKVSGKLSNPLRDETRAIALHFKLQGFEWKLFDLELGEPEVAPDPFAVKERAPLPPPSAEAAASAPLAPVEPLGTTSSTQTSAIENALGDLRDVEATTVASQARQQLVALGAHSVPHLLNALIPLDLENDADLIVGQRIATTLEEITGISKPIYPGGVAGSMVGEGRADNAQHRRDWLRWWKEDGDDFVKHGRRDPESTESEEDG
jgi:hypothetical protein